MPASIAPVLKDIIEQAKRNPNSIPREFNRATRALLPKGIEENDAAGNMVRDAGKTRPLTLSNVDSKVVAQVANIPLAGFACDVVCQNQRGFIRGRHIVDNILELEAEGLIAAATSNQVPVMVAFDVD